jgi:hypothetical protein
VGRSWCGQPLPLADAHRLRLLGPLPIQKAAQGRPAAGVHEDVALEQERTRPQHPLAADRAWGVSCS